MFCSSRHSQTADFHWLYRRRAPVIEGVFAEAKQWHGLARARWRGLSKVRVQCLLVASALNLKRLASAIRSVGDGSRRLTLNSQIVRSIWRALRGFFAQTQWRLAFI
jgi:hypothetical protein